MLPEPIVATVKQCLEGGDFDPESFMRDAQGCTVSDVQKRPGQLKWTMVCKAEGGTVTGKATLNASDAGKRVSGSMQMAAEAGGQTMNFTQEWSGRWVGPCP